MNSTGSNMRRRQRQVQRQTVRSVRNTLIIIALIAICWYVYLISQDSREKNRNRPQEKATIDSVKNADKIPAVPIDPSAATNEKLPAIKEGTDLSKEKIPTAEEKLPENKN